MPLLLNPANNEITYEGRIVGELRVDDGVAKVTLNLTYECNAEEAILPLSWFGHGLNLLQKHQVEMPEVLLEVVTHDEDMGESLPIFRLLTEKTIKQDGYVWKFHKMDADPWPSVLHGHEYDHNLTLDAITGKIYDATTRAHCNQLRTKSLHDVQAQLRASKDFADAVAEHIDVHPP